MLQGTFETLSLPEVLGLLASARKSGALWLDAGPMSGVVHVEDGHCRAVETLEQRGPVDGGNALLDRLVDVCFGVVRHESGSFRFAADESAPWQCAEPVELSDALVEVDRLLKQWREVLRVIPSLDCRPRMLEGLVVDEIILDRERWTMLVAVDGRRTVRELVERTGQPMLDLCHALLELVEAGAIGIVDPDLAQPEPPAFDAPVNEPVAAPAPAPLVEHTPAPVAEPEPTPVSEPERPRFEPVPEPERVPEPAPVVELPPPPPEPAPAPAPAARVEAEVRGPEPAAEPANGTATADRGAFLRLFSGLRET